MKYPTVSRRKRLLLRVDVLSTERACFESAGRNSSGRMAWLSAVSRETRNGGRRDKEGVERTSHSWTPRNYPRRSFRSIRPFYFQTDFFFSSMDFLLFFGCHFSPPSVQLDRLDSHLLQSLRDRSARSSRSTATCRPSLADFVVITMGKTLNLCRAAMCVKSADCLPGFTRDDDRRSIEGSD